ncbi:Ubiquitin carboxyl-terminal hydrolase 47, partial [Plecturocebus cupreus]
MAVIKKSKKMLAGRSRDQEIETILANMVKPCLYENAKYQLGMSLALLLRLEHRSMIMAHCSLELLDSVLSPQSPRLECGDKIIAHCSLELLGSSDPLTPAFQVAGTTGVHHNSWLLNSCRDEADLINELYQGKLKDYVRCLECGYEGWRIDTYLDIPLVIRPYGSSQAFAKMGSHSVDQADVKLLASSSPSVLASQSAGISSMHYHTQP